MGILGKFRQLSVTGSSDPAREIKELFPVAGCAIEDCESCQAGPLSGQYYPSSLSIETDGPLWGSVKPWSLHVVVATGKIDWIHTYTDDKKCLATAIDRSLPSWEKLTGGKAKISNSSLAPPSEYFEYSDSKDPAFKPSKVLLLPYFVEIQNITPHSAEQDLVDVVNAYGSVRPHGVHSTNGTTNGNIAESPLPQNLHLRSGHTVSACNEIAHILICSHKTRDKRCGITAKILEKEFSLVLRDHGLQRDFDDTRPGGVKIHMISHVGGHKYAANVMIYLKTGQVLWLARVKSEHVQAIVENTILQGKVFPELLRGAFIANPIAW